MEINHNLFYVLKLHIPKKYSTNYQVVIIFNENIYTTNTFFIKNLSSITATIISPGIRNSEKKY